MNKYIFLFTGLLLLTAACDREDVFDLFQTRGKYVEQTQSVEPFSGVDIGKGIDAIIRQGDEPDLEIHGWKNLLPDVAIFVDPTTRILHIEDKNKYNFVRSYSNRTTVYITYAEPLTYLRVESDANLQSKDTLKNDFLFLGEHGGGRVFLLADNNNVSVGVNLTVDVRIEGKTNALYVNNWGDAPLFFENLTADYVDVSHRGLSDIFVNARNELKVECFSLGNVFYTGQPAVTEIQHGKGGAHPR